MSVDFTEVPSTYAVPGSYTEVVTQNSGANVQAMPLRALLIGVWSAAGQGEALRVYPNITGSEASRLAGSGSAAAQMVATFTADAPYTAADMILVATTQDATATEWSIKPTGTAMARGTLAIEVCGRRIAASIKKGAGAADLSAALFDAWQAGDFTGRCGVTARLDKSASSLVLTSVDRGAWTRDIDVRVGQQYGDGVTGVLMTITQTAQGTGMPDIAPALNVVAETWYTDMAWIAAGESTLAALTEEAARRYNAMIKLDTHIYISMRATYGEALALAGQLNSEHLTILPAQKARFAPWEAAASLCAVAATSLNADPARQLHTLALTSLAGRAPDDADRYSDAMRNILLQSGMSSFNVAQDGAVQLERVVTTRQWDGTGNLTSGWRDIMVPKTATRVRYAWNTYMTSTYPRAKLADDGSPLANLGGNNVVTPKTLKLSWIGQSAIYEGQMGWLDNSATLSAQATFERDRTDRNRVNARLPVQIMGSLMVIANSLQLQV